MYSRFSPSTSRTSFLTTVPAPWCGYTTLSPTLYNRSPFPNYVRSRQAAGGQGKPPAGLYKFSKNGLNKPTFQGFLRRRRGKCLLVQAFGCSLEPRCDGVANRFRLDDLRAGPRGRAHRSEDGGQTELGALLESALGLRRGAKPSGQAH